MVVLAAKPVTQPGNVVELELENVYSFLTVRGLALVVVDSAYMG